MATSSRPTRSSPSRASVADAPNVTQAVADAPLVAPAGTAPLRRRYERLAWLILLASFGAFLTLVIGGPLVVRYYLNNAMVARTADLEVIRPIVQVRSGPNTAPIAVSDQARLDEGQTIVTDNESRGLLTFFDNSTVQVYPNTIVRLDTLRAPRFGGLGLSQRHNEIALEVVSGTIKVGVAPQIPTAGPQTDFQVTSPHMAAQLSDGGYFFDVTTDTTDVQAYNSPAVVGAVAGGEPVMVRRGEHTRVANGRLPAAPAAGEVDLIADGDFTDRGAVAPSGSAGPWEIKIDQGSDGGSVDPTWEVMDAGDRRALHFKRAGSEIAPGRGNYAAARAVQTLNRNLPNPYTSLKLRADIKIDSQSLSGGGYLSTEYPLILRVLYKDVYGSDVEWFKGFYIQNDNGNPTLNGERIKPGVWVPVEFDLHNEGLLPFQIMSVEARAAGWDFDSSISNIQLVVE
ncbi:MAG: hypothetical protein U0641_02175 [Anaerolineae bacterium]